MLFEKPFNKVSVGSLTIFMVMIVVLGFKGPVAAAELDADLHVDDTKVPVEPKGIVYRTSDKILADVLQGVKTGDVASDSMIALIQTELDLTGREMPDLWIEAMRHPVGVQAMKTDIASSVLWVARCLVTESNRPAEFGKVAWVIRNRVDNNFGGEAYYRTVILDRAQFSHFNTAHGRSEMENVGYDSHRSNFQQALKVAFHVLTAPESERPFASHTMFYYSSVSMSPSYSTFCRRRHKAAEIKRIGRAHPKWADDYTLTATGPDPERFRFMSNR